MVMSKGGRLDHDVAEAADAWINDPRDTQAYSRLVQAVLTRRRYVHPTLDDPAIATTPPDDTPLTGQPEPVGDSLRTDPRAALARLRDTLDRDAQPPLPG